MKRPVRGDLVVPETQENPIFSANSPADQGEIGVNESGTVSQSGTKLTQPNPVSFTVPPDLKHHIRILRKKFGADTPIGHRASNVEEALLNLPHSEQSIRRQLTDIARLSAQPSQHPLQT